MGGVERPETHFMQFVDNPIKAKISKIFYAPCSRFQHTLRGGYYCIKYYRKFKGILKKILIVRIVYCVSRFVIPSFYSINIFFLNKIC